MPSSLDRVQTLLQPEEYAMVKTLAKHNKRAMSAMAAELVEEALKLPKYRAQLQEADIQVPVREDTRGYVPRTQIRKGESSRPEGVEGEDYKLVKGKRESSAELEEVKAELKGLKEAMPELQLLLKSLGVLKKD